jgi:hypothetical protein
VKTTTIPASTNVALHPNEIDYKQFARDYTKWTEEMTRVNGWGSGESQGNAGALVGFLVKTDYKSICKTLVYAMLDIVFGGVDCKERVLSMLVNDECTIMVTIPHAVLPETTCYTICFSPTLECLTSAQGVETGADSVTVLQGSDDRKRFAAHILLNCSMLQNDRNALNSGNNDRNNKWLWDDSHDEQWPTRMTKKFNRRKTFLWMIALMTAHDSPGSPPPSSKEEDITTAEKIEKMKIQCLEDALRVSSQRNAMLTKMLHTRVANPESRTAPEEICEMAETHTESMTKFVEATIRNLDEAEKIVSEVSEKVPSPQQQPPPAIVDQPVPAPAPQPPQQQPQPLEPEHMEDSIQSMTDFEQEPQPQPQRELDPTLPTVNTIMEYYIDTKKFKHLIDHRLEFCCDTLETICNGLGWMSWHVSGLNYIDLWDKMLYLVVSVLSRATNGVVTEQLRIEKNQKKPPQWEVEHSNRVLQILVNLGKTTRKNFKQTFKYGSLSSSLKKRYAKLNSSISTASMTIRIL